MLSYATMYTIVESHESTISDVIHTFLLSKCLCLSVCTLYVALCLCVCLVCLCVYVCQCRSLCQ